MKRKITFAFLAATVVAMFISVMACTTPVTYELRFDSNGGSAIKSVRAEKGKNVSRPANPTKDFYVFDNWYADPEFSTVFDFVMPAHDVTVYANWIGNTTSQIFFDSDGGTPVETITQLSGSAVVAPKNPTKEGYTFGGWFEGDSAFNFTVMPENNVYLKARWLAGSGYSYVTFDLNGETYSTVPVLTGQPVAEPELFLGDGIEITEWYTDESLTNAYNFNSAVSGSITLYAQSYSKGLVINNGTVTGYTGGAEVIIPKYYGGSKVTAIADDAFINNKTIVNVTLPDSVKSIGKNAFYNCSYLYSINLTENVTQLGSFAFYSCVRLRYVGTLKGVTAIPQGLFTGCNDLRGVTLSDNLQSIGEYAFSDCTRLTEISVADTVRSIQSYALSGTAISSFNLPANLTVLGDGVFDECMNLSRLTISAGNTHFSVEDGNLFTDNGHTLIKYMTMDDFGFTKTESMYLASSRVTKISKGAFANNATLTTLIFGNSVSFELGALKNMQSLTSIELGKLPVNSETGETYFAYLFGAAKAIDNGTSGNYIPATLKEVVLTNSVAELPAYAFYGCKSIESITGIENVVTLGTSSLAYTGITQISLGAAFVNFANNDPNAVFIGCENLVSVTIAPASSCGFATFDGCIYLSGYSELRFVPPAKRTIEYSSKLTTIKENAFAYSAMESIVIPETVTRIELGALRNVNELKELTLPFIGESSTAVQNAYVPYIFGATKTDRMENGTRKVTWSGTNYIPGTLETLHINVALSVIPDFTFYYMRGLRTVTFADDGAITSIGMYAYYGTAISNPVLNEGLLSIGEGAFASCNNITEVIIPSTCKIVGLLAFAYNTSLERVVISEGVEEIGEQAFIAPRTLYTSNAGYLYGYHSSLKYVEIPASVRVIKAAAFAFAGANFRTTDGGYDYDVEFELKLESKNSKLEELGAQAFYVSAIKEITLGASLKTIPELAFEYCELLTKVVIGSKEEGSALKRIEGRSFASCTKLQSLVLYATSVPEIVPYDDGNGNLVRDFLNRSTYCRIYVPKQSLDDYAAANIWSTMKDKLYSMEDYVEEEVTSIA